MNWIGHKFTSGGCSFRVWAPKAKKLSLQLESSKGARLYPLSRDIYGYWQAKKLKIGPKARYFYILEGTEKRADPASYWQPEGVFGPSETIDLANFRWEDSLWEVCPLKDFIIYELHVGTFSARGDFPSVMDKFGYLKDLGVNAIQIMPVSQFSGDRNWGYDGVFPFSVQNTYGGPRQLQQLVNAAHCMGLAVILDVVYNHLGPEGNYFAQFGPYFTSAYQTPWGKAVNFDGPWSREVRKYFIYNALFWFKYFHIDALRLDAVHGIFDFSAKHFLAQLALEVNHYCFENKKNHYLIAESDKNDSTIIRDEDLGGYGIHAQWNDDFHHSLHACITGEKEGYYADFGKLAHLKKALEQGYCYDGNYSAYRKKNHGNSSRGLGANKFIVFMQNHDQVGNRMLGERLCSLVGFEACKLAAAMVILSPYIPLLFMGEEYAETNPFLYFTSHKDSGLSQSVARGRAKEFSSFRWKGAPPHPQHVETFKRSKLSRCTEKQQKVMLNYYKALIRLKKRIAAQGRLAQRAHVLAAEEENKVLVFAAKAERIMLVIASFNKKDAQARIRLPSGDFEKVFCSADIIWGGPGSIMPHNIKGEKIFSIRSCSFNLYLYC